MGGGNTARYRGGIDMAVFETIQRLLGAGMAIVVILNDLFGWAWIPALVIVIIGKIDSITGSLLFYKLMDLLDLDDYNTLSEKYSDPDREVFSEERHFAYSNYLPYIREIIRARDFEYARQLRRVKRAHDYITLYYMEQAWDGDIQAKQWLRKDWEE